MLRLKTFLASAFPLLWLPWIPPGTSRLRETLWRLRCCAFLSCWNLFWQSETPDERQMQIAAAVSVHFWAAGAEATILICSAKELCISFISKFD